jgi:ABC-type branched-subunit amino acid transport system substrate-binding protein
MTFSAIAVRRRHRARVVLASLAVGALVLAACGDDDDNSAATTAGGGAATTSGGAATTGGGTETTAGGGGTKTTAGSGALTAEPPDTVKPTGETGEPIKVMTETAIDTNLTPYENIRDASKYYAQWVNEQGGLVDGNGVKHKLEVTFCDDKYDANEAANCARTAVDQKLVANIGGFTIDASRAIPIYEENKVAWFGVCCPIVDQENKSPISFPLGFVGGFPSAAAIKMNEDGCKHVADANGDLPVAEVFHNLFLNGWKAAGRTDPVPSIKFPLAPGDYSSQVAQIPEETDCFFGNLGEAVWPSLLTAAKKLGREMRFYGPQGNLDAKVAKDYPDETQGAVIMGVYPDITTEVFADYRAALEKYKAPQDGSIDWNSLGGLGTWTAYVAFADIIAHMKGEITAQSFLEAAQSTTSLKTQGILPRTDLTKEWTGGGGQFPRIFNRIIYMDVIKDGKLTPLPGTIDVTNPVDGNPE